MEQHTSGRHTKLRHSAKEKEGGSLEKESFVRHPTEVTLTATATATATAAAIVMVAFGVW
jgi:hypothetical protein